MQASALDRIAKQALLLLLILGMLTYSRRLHAQQKRQQVLLEAHNAAPDILDRIAK